MDISGYLRQIRALPPQVVLRKAAGRAQRTAGAWTALASDILLGSYGAESPDFNPAARISIKAEDIPPDLEATLRVIGSNYLQHRFDLLGSGWVSPAYGFQATGFLGHGYASRSPKAPDRAGNGIEAVVNRSNVARSRQIWRLISQSDYTSIDWQLDFRSGYRWSARRPNMLLLIPVDCGADIKVPWELARLQHLPQLALCATLAAAGRSGFEPASRYVTEISDQLADFIATNPPRFGVNWMGTMDAGIRAANIALTLALLAGTDLALPAAVNEVVARSLNDHARYVVEHLEYSETGRSNHYLANLGGVLWASWLLTGEDAERRLVFAIAEILKEADNQFLADGGNYEGSTGYHRLSAEIVLFALAVIVSLDGPALERLERAAPPRRAWRAGFPRLPFQRFGDGRGGKSIVPPGILQKLQGAAQLSSTIQGADDTVIQIGDSDSGRFFKLHPAALPAQFGGSSGEFAENTLDHRGLPDGVAVLLGVTGHARTLDRIVVQRLIGAAGTFEPPQSGQQLADFGNLEELIARWRAAPEASRRVRRMPLGENVELKEWKRAAFPEFGLYVFRHRESLISFRCSGAPPKSAPRGHRHDDNLSIEYRLKTGERRDPGSFVYTPSVERRNQYRAATAHDVPRAHGQPLARIGSALFDLEEIGHARCLCWRPDGVAGEVVNPAMRVLRIVQITSQEMTIFDFVEAPAEIDDVSSNLPVSRGYGRL
jgi:hypothetical protein